MSMDTDVLRVLELREKIKSLKEEEKQLCTKVKKTLIADGIRELATGDVAVRLVEKREVSYSDELITILEEIGMNQAIKTEKSVIKDVINSLNESRTLVETGIDIREYETVKLSEALYVERVK